MSEENNQDQIDEQLLESLSSKKEDKNRRNWWIEIVSDVGWVERSATQLIIRM